MASISVPRHILAVNHSPHMLRLFDGLLSGAGYRVTAQPTAVVDLVFVLHLAPDLVVLDAMWLTDSVVGLLQALATEPRTRTIPVVFCTAPVRAVDTLAARLEGLTVRVLAKPYILDELLAVIDSVLPEAA